MGDPQLNELDRTSRVYVAGHRGLVGSAIWRRLEQAGFSDLIGEGSQQLDLRQREAVFAYFRRHRPHHVVLAAARVGGIGANQAQPYDFLSENLQIQANVLDAAMRYDVERLLFLGSSCIYPRESPQPIPESALLTGPLEPTNEAYAVAKIAGLLAVRAARRQHGRRWISAMPTNLYGPGDNFSPESSHVLPALIRRYVDAVACGAGSVTNWGSGRPRREFMHVDDMADAALFLLDHYDGDDHVNVGTGKDVTIREVADMVAGIAGFSGSTFWDVSNPDGTPRKLLDVSRLSMLGWTASIDLREGLERTIEWYRSSTAR